MIDGETKLLGVLGWPVEHSMSPVMHNAAIEAAGLNACYVPFPCAPEALGDVIAGLRGLGFLGANVTIPHKQAVIEHLDGLSEESRFTGSVNTLYWEGDRLIGTSTDATGAVLNLRQAGIELDGMKVTILGTGGASRALAFALARGRLCGVVGGRTGDLPPSRTQHTGPGPRKGPAGWQGTSPQTARRAPPSAPARWRSSPHSEAEPTSSSTAPLSAWLRTFRGVPSTPRPSSARHAVYDIVYQPRETVLLGEAKRRGCPTVEGIGMLVHQGAASFRTWFGREPDTEVMFSALGPFGYG